MREWRFSDVWGATVQQQNIEIMQTEIRGIQLENRRLIERFFGTEENQ